MAQHNITVSFNAGEEDLLEFEAASQQPAVTVDQYLVTFVNAAVAARVEAMKARIDPTLHSDLQRLRAAARLIMNLPVTYP